MSNPYEPPQTSSETTPAGLRAVEPADIASADHPTRSLSLFDSMSIIVGVIVGATIYQSHQIAREVPSPAALVSVWLAGGAAALVGALCYAELATTYPRDGGTYVYLSRAFGPRIGFLFAWAELWIVRPGSIGAMAFVFADYANALVPIGDGPVPLIIYAAATVVVLTGINLMGLKEGKWTQNLLTVTKVIGLLLVIVVGLSQSRLLSPVTAATATNFPLAFIFVMFAYGGWNEVGFVAAEVKNPRRNIPWALLLGLAVVTAIYVLVNVAFSSALTFEGMQSSNAVAADVMRLAWGDVGARLISGLVCITTLGAINGQIFAGARIYYAVGRDRRDFGWLGRWNAATNTPTTSLIVQGLVCLVPIIVFGIYEEGFRRMVIYTTPVFFFFFLLVAVSLVLLRRREPDRSRPFHVPLYPLTPALFAATSLFMLYSSLEYGWNVRSVEALWSIVVLALGGLLSVILRSNDKREPKIAAQ
jgi:basic amino acid/polyamine antiporter, APA family